MGVPELMTAIIPLFPTLGLTLLTPESEATLSVTSELCSWRVQASLPFETPCMKYFIINLTPFHL